MPTSTPQLARPVRALVRDVSSRFSLCLRERADIDIDVVRAQLQHAGYVAVLERLGIAIEHVEPNDAHADGCFVEDTAVVTGKHAVLTIPGAPSRQAETREVLPVLERHCTVQRMAGAARLDGGDVLRARGTLFVGLSSRTNQAGADFLAEVAARDGLETRTVPLAHGLHLKSVCTLLDPETIVCSPSLGADVGSVLRTSGCALLEAPEELGANLLALGDTVLVSANAPRTAALVRARGLHAIEIDVSELHLADGALTCLSIRVPRDGAYCA
jgi:dimethylargininase